MQDNRVYNEYDRYLSPLDVLAITFGCTIGWGAFVMPGTSFLPAAGPLGTLVALAIGVGVMLVIGANFSYLMQHQPGTGGVYAYTKAAFGRDHAFLCAWFLCLSYLTIVFLNATALFTVIRTVFGSRLQIGYNYYNIGGNVIFMGEVGASIVALSIVGLLFINAKPLLQRLHTALVVILLACVLLVTAVCLPHLSGETFRAISGVRGGSPVHAVFSLVMLAPWAFVGFEVVSLETAHFDFKVRNSRWIMLASILLSGLVYASLTLVSVSAAPDGYASWQAYIADLDRLTGLAAVPSFFAAKSVLGSAGLLLMAVAAVAAILTGMIAGYRATARILSTMAEDRILSEKFSQTTYSILFIMLISIAISLFGRNALQCFVELTSFGAVIAFGYTSASAWKLAKRRGSRKVAVTGALGTAASVVFGVAQLIPKLTAMEMMGADAFLVLSVWCLLGFMFYLRIVARSGAAPGGSASASGVVMFALLLYSVLMWLGKRLMAAETIQAVRQTLRFEGALMLVVIFIGLCVMIYIQRLVHRQHEDLRRRWTRASRDAGDEDSSGPDAAP